MDKPSTSLAELELSVLRALLSQAQATGGARSPGTLDLPANFGDLASHPWSDEEHRVVYQCFRTAHRNPAVSLREEMAAQATRMGHPEVDWSLYFNPTAEDVDLADLIRTLSKASSTP